MPTLFALGVRNAISPVGKMTRKPAPSRGLLSFSLPRAPVRKQQACSPSARRISEEMTASYKASDRSFQMLIVWTMSLSWLGLSSSLRGQVPATPAGKHVDQVVIVVMENAGTDQALADPYIASLSRRAASFSRYYAI